MSQIGRYRILKELGRGGMAVVYHAQDPNLNNRDVAIKVISTYLSADNEFRARFSREAQAIATLDHPAIVPLYDFGEQNDQPYIVMRYMSGKSLQDRLAHGAFSWADTVSHLTRISEALDHAHQHGVIHRDLKPANLLFDQFDNLYLADFGIVKLLQNDATAATQGSLGTPQYMAPEIWDGAKATAQTDVYAIGCVAYEMLTGDVLFAGDSQSEIITKHLVKGPEFPVAWPSNLPPNLDRIFRKCLAKNPAERYRSVGEFVMALQMTNEATLIMDGGDKTLVEAPADLRTVIEQPVAAAPVQPAAAPQPIQPQAAASTPSMPAAPPPQPAAAQPNSKRGVIIAAVLGVGLCLAVVVGGLLISTWRSGLLGQVLGGEPTAVAIATEISSTEEIPPTEAPTMEPTTAPEPTAVVVALSNATVSLGAYATQSILELLPEFPLGEQEFGGVKFLIDDPGKVGTQTQSTPDEAVDHGLAPETLAIPVGPFTQAETVYVLMNVGFGVGAENKEIGALQLAFEDGRTYDVPLIMNSNIREWGVVQPFNSPDLSEAYKGPNRFGDDSVIDMLTVPVPIEYQDSRLVSVNLVDRSQDLLGSPDPGIFIVGLTVESRTP